MDGHRQRIAPHPQARAAPGVFDVPAGPAAQALSRGRIVEDVQTPPRRPQPPPPRAGKGAAAARTTAAGRPRPVPPCPRACRSARWPAAPAHAAALPAMRQPAARSVSRSAHAGKHREQQPIGEVRGMPQGAGRPHDGPHAFAHVIGPGREPRVPPEVLQRCRRARWAGRPGRWRAAWCGRRRARPLPPRPRPAPARRVVAPGRSGASWSPPETVAGARKRRLKAPRKPLSRPAKRRTTARGAWSAGSASGRPRPRAGPPPPPTMQPPPWE